MTYRLGILVALLGSPVGSALADTDIGQVLLAPDGEYVAASVSLSELPGARNLVTMRLADGAATAITGFADATVSNYFWANDDRLVFSIETAGTVGKSDYRGSYTILRDGSGGLKLQERRLRPTARASAGVMPPLLLHRLPNEWNSVLVARAGQTAGFPDVFQLDPSTGRSRRIVANEFSITHWLSDNRGVIRAAIDKGADVLDGQNRLMYRDSAETEWRLLRAFNEQQMEVLGFHADNLRLIVLADGEVGGKALHYLKPNGVLGQRLLSDATYGLANRQGAAGLVQAARGDIIYYQYMADQLRTVYFDARWESRQKEIDEALRGSTNTIVSWSDDERQLLVLVAGDEGRDDYYLFDTTFRELKFLPHPGDWIR